MNKDSSSQQKRVKQVFRKKTKREESPNLANPIVEAATKRGSLTIGLDLGDRTSQYCMLNQAGEMVEEGSVETTKAGLEKQFKGEPRCRIALEVGSHSPWVSRLLTELGHEVIVANPRQLQVISQSSRKNDKADAETLARLARADVKLLRPVKHRSAEAQEHLLVIRVRAELVDVRTSLINSARGLAKAFGERLPGCDADQMGEAKLTGLPVELKEPLQVLMKEIETLTKAIEGLNDKVDKLAKDEYPETRYLTQIFGVGNLIALTFILTIDDPDRFEKSRDVGAYVGLRPKQRESGKSKPQLGISKEGDRYLRKLLVQAAQCHLGARAPDTDLHRWGRRLAGRGGKNAKKRAVVAVARKIGILLHRLWVDKAEYEPLRQGKKEQQPKAA